MAGKNLVLHLLPKMPPANQTAVFFNHQYPWKESSDILDFLHRSNYQAKLASGTTCFGWVWAVGVLVQSDRRIL